MSITLRPWSLMAVTAVLCVVSCATLNYLIPTSAFAQDSVDKEEMEGRKRLTTMLELEILFNQYGYTNLPPDILGKVRHLAQENWPVLPERVRKDLKPYFSIHELEAFQHPEIATPPTAGTFSVEQPAQQPHLETSVVSPATTTAASIAASSAPMTTLVSSLTTPALASSPASVASGTPPLPAYLDVTPAVFDKFLAEAPYDHDIKAILKIISNHAPTEYRRTALGITMRYLPQIIIDSNRAGTHHDASRHELHSDLHRPGGYSIALNPGVLLVKKGNFLTGSDSRLMPKTTDYLDSSTKSIEIQFPPEQMAGTLLKELLSTDGHLRGWDRVPYHSELRSESARLMFYDKLRRDTGKPPVLTAELEAKFDEWKNRPLDYLDFTCQTLSSPARAILASSTGNATASPTKYLSFTPSQRTFTCDVPSHWPPFEEESLRGNVVHFLGPIEADGAFRAAIHIHFVQKGHAAFIPIEAAIKETRKQDKAARRSISASTPWRVAGNRAQRFEATETRQLPDGLLPSRSVVLHHSYVFVQAMDGYFMIKLSATQETYLNYRDDFNHLLETFRIIGDL